MKPHWKLIAFELILEIILEIGPASLSMLAAVSEYLVDLSNVAGRDSVQLLVSSIRPQMNRRGYVIDLAQYSFTSLPQVKPTRARVETGRFKQNGTELSEIG